jgi:hypothetical protein
LSQVVIARQFRGPPNSANGGYACGLMAEGTPGLATSILRAPVPLGEPLHLERRGDLLLMTSPEGALVAQGGPAAPEFRLPEPPPAPSLAAARAAGAWAPDEDHRLFHPGCFACGMDQPEDRALRVYAGQIEGAPAGHVAGTWTPHAAFVGADGKAPPEMVWAAMDCSGHFCWCVKDGRHGALLGTMTCEVHRLPQAGEETIILAWPLERDGRKQFSGVALYSGDGELMALAHQVWIAMGPRPPAA